MAERGNKRTIKGVVVSNKMDKTIVVKAERLVKHPIFHKYVRKHLKYNAGGCWKFWRKQNRLIDLFGQVV